MPSLKNLGSPKRTYCVTPPPPLLTMEQKLVVWIGFHAPLPCTQRGPWTYGPWLVRLPRALRRRWELMETQAWIWANGEVTLRKNNGSDRVIGRIPKIDLYDPTLPRA